MRRIRVCNKCKSLPEIKITGNALDGYWYQCYCGKCCTPKDNSWETSPQKAIKDWNATQRELVKENRVLRLGRNTKGDKRNS